MATPSKAAFTAGPANYDPESGDVVMAGAVGACIATIDIDNCESVDQADADGYLIAEAFTIAHETGLTPRQLAERCKELEVVLSRAAIAVDELCHGQHPENGCWNILREVRAAIAKTGGAA